MKALRQSLVRKSVWAGDAVVKVEQEVAVTDHDSAVALVLPHHELPVPFL